MKNTDDLILEDTSQGKGVFAKAQFDVGDTICEFQGKLFSYEELPKPYDAVTDHYVQIGSDVYMGPSGGIDDFFNHSCAPNAGLKITGSRAVLVAIEKIPIGDEVVWDYSTTMDEDDWEMECHCGNDRCRHRIRDFKHLPIDLQKKYISLGIVPNYISRNFE